MMPLPGAHLPVLLLLLLGGILQLTFEKKGLSGPPADHGLRPQLVNLSRQIGPHILCDGAQAHIHGPETAVAGPVLEVGAHIRGAEKDAAAGQLLDMAAISGPETVSP